MWKIKESPLIAKARSNPDYRYDIAMLRLLAIVIVVFFHGYLITYDSFHLPSVSERFSEIYEPFNHYYLIFIAMSLFVFISGFLFGGQLLRKQPKSFVKLLKSKATRLLLPFFIFVALFSLALGNFSVDMFVTGIFVHLWFLPMLFWCFIITYLLRPLIYSKYIILQAGILVLLFGWSIFAKVLTLPRFCRCRLSLAGSVGLCLAHGFMHMKRSLRIFRWPGSMFSSSRVLLFISSAR